MKIKKTISRGFNLVEIAIVLVIFTLVITGVLRGQELINSAKARNIIDQKSSFQTAFLAFTNRYKLIAGDLNIAQAAFVGNGVIASTTAGASVSGDGRVDFNEESILVFQNLTATNLLACANCMKVTGNGAATTSNTYINSYSQSLQFGITAASNTAAATTLYWFDPTPATQPQKNILSTGSKITAAVLQQVDQKADDGLPQSGLFRQSSTDSADTNEKCTTGSTAWATTGIANCAGAWLF